MSRYESLTFSPTLQCNRDTNSSRPAVSTDLIGGIYYILFTPGKKRPFFTCTPPTPQYNTTTTTEHDDNTTVGKVTNTITDGGVIVEGNIHAPKH